MSTPTAVQYSRLQEAFDYFNQALFAGALPACLITLQRQRKTMGYASYNRFQNDPGETVHEIAMNPEFFGPGEATLIEVLSTLVHEMAHIWQYHYGNPGRGRYHNAEWADKMEEIGLMPSNTGKPGGKRTGDNMSDYPIEGGAFLQNAKILLEKEYQIPWADRASIRLIGVSGDGTEDGAGETETGEDDAPAPPTKAKIKYSHTCETDKLNAWGKPGLALVCGKCGEPYTPA